MKFNIFSKSKYQLPRDPWNNYANGVYFVHIPKTGGTSIAKTIGLSKFSHIKAWELYASKNSKLLKTNFSFGVVRNPIDRFISLFNYARMDRSYYHDNLSNPENPSFPRHLDYNKLKNSSVRECAKFLIRNELKHDMEWNQWLPQYTWLYDKSATKLLVNKVYRFENLTELKGDLKNKGFEFSDFPVLNVSGYKNYEESNLDEDTLQILLNYYKKDFELFGYK
jgi:hypothetical protein